MPETAPDPDLPAAGSDRPGPATPPAGLTFVPAAERETPLEPPQLAVIIVTHDSHEQISRSVPAIVAELRAGDELIVFDNASSDGTAKRVRELAPDAVVLEAGANLGFGAACNAGAAAARNGLLLFLNPDATVEPGFRDAIELPVTEGRGWDAWQGLVTDEGGSKVNSWGGEVHFTGIAWAGGAGRPIAEAPTGPREITFPSGACLAILRDPWQALGGFSEEHFLYHEDTDLGLRLWLCGYRVGLEPRARADHDYEFDKGSRKWLYLERNRYATVIRTYPWRVRLATAPGMLVTELALLVVAGAGGWLPAKLHAYAQTCRALPRLSRERARIHDADAGLGPGARIDAGRFAALLGADLDSDFLGRAGRSRLLGVLLRAYWRVARALTGCG